VHLVGFIIRIEDFVYHYVFIPFQETTKSYLHYKKKNYPDAKTCDKNTQRVKLICAKQERNIQADRQFVSAIYDTSSIT